MDFGFTKEQEKLRKEVHEFFSNELPVEYRPGFAITKEQLSFWLEPFSQLSSLLQFS